MAWRGGRITVFSPSSAAITALNSRVFSEDSVWVDGNLIQPRTQTRVAMLHKPARVTSTARDPQGKADLQPWLRQLPEGMFPVGRLDRETTGLLLFTDNGDLANALLRPTHHAIKRYWLWLDEEFTPDDSRLSAMTQLNSDFDRVDAAVLYYQDEAGAQLHLTLSEGKNRQIRRLCSALNLRLQHLHRFAIGPLGLDSLPSGQLRQLNPSEIHLLWQAAGGRSHVEQAQLAALYREAAEDRAAGTPHRRLETFLSGYDLTPRTAF